MFHVTHLIFNVFPDLKRLNLLCRQLTFSEYIVDAIKIMQSISNENRFLRVILENNEEYIE